MNLPLKDNLPPTNWRDLILIVFGWLAFCLAHAAAPQVTNVSSATADGTYHQGAVISIEVAFDQGVTVTGAPTLTLNSGGVATYASGSPGTSLTFSYTVGAAENSVDLDYSSTNALALNNGSILLGSDAAMSANLTLPAPGAAGSLGANKAIVIADNSAPALAVGDIVVNNHTQPNTIQLTFSEPLKASTATNIANYIIRNNTGTITYALASAEQASSRTVTLTLASPDASDLTTWITNADIDAHIKVTPSNTLLDANDVAYAAGTITEDGATHTKDLAPPQLNSTMSVNSNTVVVLTFNEIVDKASAETLGNYTLGGTGGLAGAPTAATLDTSGTRVSLTIPAMVDLANGKTVTITASSAITDLAGNPISSAARMASFTVVRSPTLNFSSISNALTGSTVESDAVTISNVNLPTPVAIASGSSSSLRCRLLPADQTAWGSAVACDSLMVNAGDQVKLSLTATTTATSVVSGGIVIGEASGYFSVTTAAPVLIPSTVTTAVLTRLDSAILNPHNSLFISGNGVVVVPEALASPISVLYLAPENTAFSIQTNSSTAFAFGSFTSAILPITSDVLAVLKNFKVDNYAGLRTLEIVKGRAVISGTDGISPIASIQVGQGTATKQIAITPYGTVSPVVDIKINTNGTAVVAVKSGSVMLRLASTASTITSADSPTPLGANQVANISATGAVTSILQGGVDSDTTMPTLTSIASAVSNTAIALTFSESLEPVSATTLANYTLSGSGGLTGKPIAASLDTTGTQVTLTIPTIATIAEGKSITVAASANITDLAGNGISPTANTATLLIDRTPADLTFASKSKWPVSTDAQSEGQLINGINVPVAISVDASSSATLKCARLPAGASAWSAFSACAGFSVANGDQLKLQLTSALTASTSVAAFINIGGTTANFSVATAPLVLVPTDVTFSASSSLTNVIASPDSNMFVSGNGVVVIPATLVNPVSVLYTAPANTAFSVQNGSGLTIFSLVNNAVSISPVNTDVFTVLKYFKVDGYEGLRTLEFVKGRAIVSGTDNVSPVASLRLGRGRTTTQVAILPTGAVSPVVDIKVDSTGVGFVAVVSGSVALRLASAESAITDTDGAIPLYANEVASLSPAGTVTSIRVGSMDGDTGVVGDRLKFDSTSLLTADIERNAKIPNLGGALERISSGGTLLQSLFDAIGLRSNLARGGQTSQGIVPLSVEGANFYLVPIGDVIVDTARNDGVSLDREGFFEISRNGVVAKFRASLLDTKGFAMSMVTAMNAKVTMTPSGAMEILHGGKTMVAMPELGSLFDETAANGVGYDGDGYLNFVKNRERQRLLPCFYDLKQLVSSFGDLAEVIDVQDNLDGTVTAVLDGTAYTLAPSYDILSPLGEQIPFDHRDDNWWVGDDGLIYIKYSNGSAQGFSIR